MTDTYDDTLGAWICGRCGLHIHEADHKCEVLI